MCAVYAESIGPCGVGMAEEDEKGQHEKLNPHCDYNVYDFIA